MYVCVCNAVTDREIKAAVASGARSFDDVRDSLGVSTCCGKCADCARGVVDRALDALAAPVGNAD